jgi:formylglycine-generating enzyme required for sulfatase activity
VVDLSWGDAKEFCKWLTQKERDNGRIRDWQEYRLPTDAEWSIAVGRTEYPWGNQWPPPEGAGNYAGEEAKSGLPSNWLIIDDYNDGWPRTSPVGSFRANQFGLYDMGGNVWQWVEDLIGRGQTARVIRGGSWRNSTSGTMRSSNSAPCTPDEGFCDLGFRCVLAGHSFN